MPKISVIVPVYNASKTINKCIDSILNQNFKDIEIICIDDNSTDNSLQILKIYENKYKNIFIKESDSSGAGKSRNIGMDCATGDYFYFLDSDDFLENDALETMYAEITKYDADVLIFNYYQNNISSNECTKIVVKKTDCIIGNIFKAKDMSESILNDYTVFVWNKLFKAEFIRENNIRFQEILRTNDLFFVRCAMLLADKIYYIDKSLIYYTVGQTTNIQNNNYKVPTEFTKSILKLKDFLIQNNLYEEYRKSYNELVIEEINHALMSLKSHPAQYYKLARYLDKKILKELNLKKSDTKMWSYLKILFVWIFSIRSFRGTGYKVMNVFGHQIWIKCRKSGKG